MKLHAWLSAALMAGVAAVSANEELFEDFDRAPTGSVTQIAGWGGSSSAVPLIYAATVTDGPGFSEPNHLSLPYSGGLAWGTRALYTNFYRAFSPAHDHPIIEASAWIRVNRADLDWRMGIESSADNRGLFLCARVSDGELFLTNEVNGQVNYSGEHVSTGRYVAVQFFYNRTNGEITCHYNGTNILQHWDAGTPVRTVFDRFSLYRPSGDNVAGTVEAEDVSVSTFPLDTLAWWRFHAPSSATSDLHRLVIAEGTGYFQPGAPVSVLDGVDDASASDPLYDGYDNWRNPRTLQRGAVGPVWPTGVTGIFSNWTVEAFVRLREPGNSWTVLDWGTPPVPSMGSNSWISMHVGTGGLIRATLRDRFEVTGNSDYYGHLGVLPMDGAWHHVALVKSGSNLTSYVDYHAVSSVVLRTRSRFEYSFYAHHQAAAGFMVNHAGLIMAGDALDEVRVTKAALPTRRMLQFGPPVLLTQPSAAGVMGWQMNVRTIPLFLYALRASTSPASGSWVSDGTQFATGHVTTMYISATNWSARIIRAEREWLPPP